MDGDTDKLGEPNDKVETELIPNCFCFLYKTIGLCSKLMGVGVCVCAVNNFGDNIGNDFKA